jgi:CubicO group peptidase (beta-lactamase class C family)
LGGLEVAVEDPDAPNGYRTVPTDREITVLDIMRHTAGFTYGFVDGTAVDRLYKEKKILDSDQTLEEFITKLASLPLLHQPGTIWDYSVAVDVQGRLIEVLSGQTLDVFLQERMFNPLGMVDTGFYVPEEKHDRLASVYALSMWGKLGPVTDMRSRDFTKKPKLLSGGGGLVSTAHDYLQFCRMMLNKGELNGKRYLKEETVALMNTDQLGDIPVAPMGIPLGMVGAGFGLDFAVTKDAFKDTRGSVGEYNWGGAASTYFWIGPAENMIGIYMIQIFPPNYSTPIQFKKMSYDAVK